jgi:hypothetical protein
LVHFSALIFGFLVSVSSHAEWITRPQAGVGFTSNANYEDSGEDADFYLFLRNSATHFGPRSEFNLWLSYKAYLEENQNSHFNWRAGSIWPKRTSALGLLDIDIGVGGQHYTANEPGTTEENFDNFYGEGAGVKSRSLRPGVDLRLESGYQLKYFPRLSGRLDHTVYFQSALDWFVHGRNRLSPFGEFGMVFSNDSLFRKNYLELGVDWVQLLRADLKLNLGFLSRFSTYPNRTVSQETIVSRRRGTTKTSSREENETHSYIQIKGSIVKILGSLEMAGSLILNSQNSKSGYEDYSELGVLGSLTFVF